MKNHKTQTHFVEVLHILTMNSYHHCSSLIIFTDDYIQYLQCNKKHTSIDRIDKFIYFMKIITLETIRFNLINFDNDDDE